MNELTIAKKKTAMTTVEIANQTGKRHDHVMRDTKNMLTELYGNEGCPKFGGTYTDVQNKQQPCYFEDTFMELFALGKNKYNREDKQWLK